MTRLPLRSTFLVTIVVVLDVTAGAGHFIGIFRLGGSIVASCCRTRRGRRGIVTTATRSATATTSSPSPPPFSVLLAVALFARLRLRDVRRFHRCIFNRRVANVGLTGRELDRRLDVIDVGRQPF